MMACLSILSTCMFIYINQGDSNIFEICANCVKNMGYWERQLEGDQQFLGETVHRHMCLTNMSTIKECKNIMMITKYDINTNMLYWGRQVVGNQLVGGTVSDKHIDDQEKEKYTKI